MSEYPLSRLQPELLAALTQIAQECDFDAAKISLKTTKLRTSSDPELVRAGIEVVLARQKATFLGPWVSQALLTRRAVEQSTHPLVAQQRAQRYSGRKHVLEIGSGLGVDCAALARVANRVTSIEADAEVAEALKYNLSLQGVTNVTVIAAEAATAVKHLNLSDFDALWADPSRRDSQGQRLMHAEAWNPPLSFVTNLPLCGLSGIKISPGWNFDQLPQGFVRQWIGMGDECVEQTLWRGTDFVDGSVSLPDRNINWTPAAASPEPTLISPESISGQYLIEPHAALIRSGKLAGYFSAMGASLLDPQIAYGICQVLPERSALYASFKVLESFPYGLSRLQERIQALGWNSRTEIKKRGFPETSDEVRARLRFSETKNNPSCFGVVLLTRVGERHHCFLAERV
ncbi:MAG: RsmD family RNA methyltransferase [Oligoflexia bacterium]|nr:RsmD family RNA methyltransferase [Oligoflexia bacterium]